MSKLCRKLLVFAVTFLFSGALALSLASCGGGGNDIVYKVNFYSDADTNYAVVEVGEDGKISLPTNPTKSGYVFTGWYTDSATQNLFDASTNSVSSNINLYAGWRQLPSAPSGLKWNARTETISWDAVSSAEGYSYTLSIDGTEITGLTSTSYAYSNTGDHQVKVKTVYTTASYTDQSVWSGSVSFSIAAPTYTVNFMNGETLYRSVEVVDGEITLPSNPSQADAHFLGWYNDSTFATAFNASEVMDLFDLTEKGDQTVNVYAKWEYKPAAPAAINRAAYENAKAGNSQRLYWAASSSSNVAGYEVSVTTMDGTVVLSGTVTTTEFALDLTKLTEGTTYFYDIVTVSSVEWEDEALKSAAYSGSFVYTIVPEDTFTVTYMIDTTTKYLSEYVTDGDTAALPNIDPVKSGSVFLKWVYGTNEDDFTNEVVITENITVFAKWAAKPVAPSTVDYADATCVLGWAEVSDATRYQYRIDDGDWVSTTSNSVTVLGLTKGNHSFELKVTAPVVGVTGLVESEVSSMHFNVETLYVGLSVDGSVTGYVAVDENGHIAKPANPELTGQQFVKWTIDGNAASSGLNFDSRIFDRTTTIYAIFASVPAQVTEAVWDEETDSISWTAVEGATAYKVAYGPYGKDHPITVTEPKIIEVGVTTDGSYPISIKTIRTDSVYGTIESEWNDISVTIEFSGELIYSVDGTQIKYVSGDKTVYIFFAGQSYNSSSKTFGTSEYYTGSGNSVVMTTDSDKIGVEFQYEFGLESRIGMIVPQIVGLNYADGYARYNSQRSESGTTFLNKTNAYAVGTGINGDTGDVNFYLPIDFMFGGGTDVENGRVDLTFTFYKWVENEWVEFNDNTFGFAKANGYRLSTSLTSGKIMVEVAPKFLNKAQYDNVQAYTKTFVFELNNGVNVYTHAELKSAYHNTDNHIVNIHGGVITAELSSEQLNPDGYARNYTAGNIIATKDSQINGDVYSRIPTGNDQITVNGNYALIDAHSIPRVYRDGSETGDDFAKQHTIHQPYGNYKIQCVTTAVFQYIGCLNNSSNHFNDRLTINDLEIYGNTEIKGKTEAEVAIYSGGHNGIKLTDASLTANNVNIHHTLIANYIMSENNYDNYSYFNEVKTDENWANGIDAAGTAGIVITKSQFLKCSGAAIHFEDGLVSENPTALFLNSSAEARATELRYDPVLAIDSETVLENMLTGSEAWFTAWGFGGMMTSQIKASGGVQGSVLTSFGNSVLKENAGQTRFNFAMLFKPNKKYHQLEVYLIDEQYGYVLGSEDAPESPNIAAGASTKPWTADPRLQGGKLLTPVGNMTAPNLAIEIAEFATAVATAKGAELQYSIAYETPDISTYSYMNADLIDAIESSVIDAVVQAATNSQDINAAVQAATTEIIMNVTYGGQFGYLPSEFAGRHFYTVTIDGAAFSASGAGLSAWIEYGPASSEEWYDSSVDA